MKKFNYSAAFVYFVTIVTRERICLLGQVRDCQIFLSPAGRIARNCWKAIPDHFPGVWLGSFVVMPNHIHGIVGLPETDFPEIALGLKKETKGPGSKPLGVIIGSFKAATTKWVNREKKGPGKSIWQRNYYEHIIRNEDSWERIQNYIIENPARWGGDPENPIGHGTKESFPWSTPR